MSNPDPLNALSHKISGSAATKTLRRGENNGRKTRPEICVTCSVKLWWEAVPGSDGNKSTPAPEGYALYHGKGMCIRCYTRQRRLKEKNPDVVMEELNTRFTDEENAQSLVYFILDRRLRLGFCDHTLDGIPMLAALERRATMELCPMCKRPMEECEVPHPGECCDCHDRRVMGWPSFRQEEKNLENLHAHYLQWDRTNAIRGDVSGTDG